MAHFAELDENNIVTQVIVVANDIPAGSGILGDNDKHVDGEIYCANLLGGTWKQTSYNHRFRKQYAGIGYTYDANADEFVQPQPYDSWTLDANNDWQPPIAKPTGYDDTHIIHWDETNQQWFSYLISDLENNNFTTRYNWNITTSEWEIAT